MSKRLSPAARQKIAGKNRGGRAINIWRSDRDKGQERFSAKEWTVSLKKNKVSQYSTERSSGRRSSQWA